MSDVAFSGSRFQTWIGATLFSVSGIKVSDKLNTEVTRRLGQQEIAARTEGEYETDTLAGQCEVLVFYRDILPQLPANGYGNFVFQGTIYASHPQSPTDITIECLECRFVGLSEDMKAEPGATTMDITISVNQIVRNGKTINRRIGTSGIGPSAAIGFAANVSGATGLAGGFLPF